MNKTLRFSLLSLLVMFCGTLFADESSLVFTEACGGTGTADDGAVWTVTSDGAESAFDSDKGIHYGTGKAAVQYIKLTTSDIAGTITKVVVNASTASGVSATADVTVGGAAFGGDAQALTATAVEYTFEGSASGEIVVTVAKPSSAVKALYVKSIVVTYEEAAPVVENYVVDNYTIDFNEAIATSAHDFAVASNWEHLVGSGNYDGSGPYYMTYSYYATSGVDGTGCLSAGRQYAGDNWGGTECTDLLITPEVKGTITLAVKKNATSNSFIEFYNVTEENGTWTPGTTIDFEGAENLTTSDWTTVTLNISDFQRIGIRASYVYIDNFTAEQANIIPEKKITIATTDPSATTGTIRWDQQANGKVLVKYAVTVTNTGDVDLTQGTEGYSVSIINGTTGDVVATTAVPQDLAVGETSDPFDVQGEVETTLWPNTYTYVKFNLRENLKNSVVQRAQSTYNAYEPKFVFRAAESTSTSSITAAESWGTITESTTKAFEIANTGTAPLTVKSVTLPEGFTSDNAPEAEFVIAKGEAQALNITLDATAQGTFADNLTIVYLDKDDAEQTYTLAFSATVIGANTWTADFNNSTSTVAWPEGAVAENGINKDYQYISSGNYNNWLVGYNTSSYKTGNNKFITPKLHANAGDKLAFDVKAGYSSSDDYFVKVYVSADRQNFGEPVETYVYSNVGSSFTTKTVTFDAEGDYYVAFALYGTGSGIDNLVGLQKVDVAHDLYIKSVSWPDASVKSGTALSRPSVDIIPLTTEMASAYTVKYVCGETVLAEGMPEALTASANSSKSFSFSWTPVVEETTVYEGTKVVFEFTDGTTFETEPFDLTVTNEAIFHFLNAVPSSKWYEPTDRTQPIVFAKTNSADEQSFVIYNWGSAPLMVNSITLPEGFSTAAELPMTVPAFDETNLSASAQTLTIVFSATAPGEYSGDMVITYSGDKTFTLPVSGTKLDPAKFYANFDDGGWPAGSVYQNNVSSSNSGTYSAPNYFITSSSSNNNLFITPKLSAQAGDKLQFDAAIYSTFWSEGKVVVYAAATRDELINFDPENDTRTALLTVSGESEDEATKLTTSYQTFEVPAVAGENFYAFEISGRPYVDEIYGLTPVAIEHDLLLVSSNIPAEGMQNIPLTATVNVLNLGLQDETDYTVAVHLGDDVTTVAGTETIAMKHRFSESTALSVNVQSPKAGTFPVFVEVKAGELVLATEPVDVTFAEEIAVAEAIEVGTRTSADRNHGPVDWYNSDGSDTRWTDIVYTADQLAAFGITAGAKITSIAFHGSGTAKSIKAKVTSWVALSTGDITPGTVDKESMTEVSVYDQTEEAALIDFSNTELNLAAAPLVYDGTSDIRIYTETVGQSSGNWQSVTYAYDTNYMTSYFNSSSAVATPLGYFTLAAEPAILTGTVKNEEGAAVENAVITLVSTDGDNVQYTGTTDAEGAFTINVIQTGRTYNVTVVAQGYNNLVEEAVSFAEGSVERNFVVFKEVTGINALDAAVKAGQVYNTQGVKMNGTLKKGVYIINGRKTVVK